MEEKTTVGQGAEREVHLEPWDHKVACKLHGEVTLTGLIIVITGPTTAWSHGGT